MIDHRPLLGDRKACIDADCGGVIEIVQIAAIQQIAGLYRRCGAKGPAGVGHPLIPDRRQDAHLPQVKGFRKGDIQLPGRSSFPQGGSFPGPQDMAVQNIAALFRLLLPLLLLYLILLDLLRLSFLRIRVHQGKISIRIDIKSGNPLRLPFFQGGVFAQSFCGEVSVIIASPVVIHKLVPHVNPLLPFGRVIQKAESFLTGKIGNLRAVRYHGNRQGFAAVGFNLQDNLKVFPWLQQNRFIKAHRVISGIHLGPGGINIFFHPSFSHILSLIDGNFVADIAVLKVKGNRFEKVRPVFLCGKNRRCHYHVGRSGPLHFPTVGKACNLIHLVVIVRRFRRFIGPGVVV